MSAVQLPIPERVPADLTRPSPRYRWLTRAVGGCLVAFAAFYAGLIVLLVHDLYRTWGLTTAGHDRAVVGWLFAPLAVILIALLVQALWGVHRATDDPAAVEVTAESEPALFALIHTLADRVGAPRPHRVLFVPGVNAAVAYDASIANLILPTRKNLIIGLGLVNALTVGQLVAVLAHEFGHFSQSSMRLGRWVYVANRIIGRVVEPNIDGSGLVAVSSRLDWRLAILVALLAVIVAFVRRAIGGLHWLVNLPERALSREMELHADKVAVSLTGSDALVEALARLQLADVALDQVGSELRTAALSKRYARDLYRLHERALVEVAVTQPALALPADHATPDPDRRLFAGDDAPPRMWASHPPGRVREENAKTPYLAAPRDDRPAWTLLARPDELRAAFTAAFNRQHLEMPADTTPVDEPSAEGKLDAGRASLYGSDFVTTGTADPEAWLLGATVSEYALVEALAGRHGPEARAPFETRRRRVQDLQLLLEFASGQLPVDEGARFRGGRLEADAVTRLAEQVRDELVADHEAIARVHREARVAVRAAAERLGPGWVAAHRDALALLHFLEHEEIRVRAIATRFRGLLEQVSSGALSGRPEKACSILFDLHIALGRALDRVGAVEADPPFAGGLPLLGEPLLPTPDGLSWTPTWVARFAKQLDAVLRGLSVHTNVALNHLLDLEDRIEVAWMLPDGEAAPAPVTGLSIPPHEAAPVDAAAGYRALVVPRKAVRAGAESQAWQAAKSLGAAAVVLLVPFAVWVYLGHVELVLYNATGTPLDVRVGWLRHAVGPGERVRVIRLLPWSVEVSTEHEGRVVEGGLVPAVPQVLYNIGRRGVLVDRENVYSARGDVEGRPDELLGNPLIRPTDVVDLLVDPPETVQTKGVTKRGQLLDAGRDVSLPALLSALDQEQLVALTSSVLRFDPPGAESEVAARMLRDLDPALALSLSAALRDRHPDHVEAHRAYQSARHGEPALVDEYRAAAEAHPTATGWYLYGRLVDDPEAASDIHQRALALDPAHVRARFALAWAHAQLGRWDRAEVELPTEGVPADMAADLWEMRLRARRAGGARGLPADLAATVPDALRTVSAAFHLEGDATSLTSVIASHPQFEAVLCFSAGDLSGARIAAERSGDADLLFLLALSGPSSGWGAALATAGPGAGSGALLRAAAAREIGRVDEWSVTLDAELAAVASALWATDPADLVALDRIARPLDPRLQWVVYAAAAVLGGDAPAPAVVERAQRLSFPWEVPRWKLR